MIVRNLFFSILLTSISFTGSAQNYNIILGRPTSHGITISIMFDQAAECYFQYGTAPGNLPESTNIQHVEKDVPLETDLNNLQPGTRYYYVTRYRPAGSSGSYLISPVYTFHTQRGSDSSFTFTIESDEHLYNYGSPGLYRIALQNQAADQPDFMLSLGDIFGNDHYPWTITSAECDYLHRRYRYLLGDICHSVPFYVCLGNHEGEKQYFLDTLAPNNLAYWSTQWRKFYYPNPFPNDFYSGDTVQEGYGIGQPENYYSWTWGNALFVVLDVYRENCWDNVRKEKPGAWDWTLGENQYQWLKQTLENSTAKFKFVFAHQIAGEGRGGIKQAHLYEWGGYNNNETWGFDAHRPGWTKTIHQLFVDNKVNIFFQGHDHIFAHEMMDGVTYQEVPMASDSTYIKGEVNMDAYTTDTLPASGHLRVTVSPSCVKVQYVRAFMPEDTLSGKHHNREISFSYTLGDCPLGIENPASPDVRIFPNPASDQLKVIMPAGIDNCTFYLINSLGQTVLYSKSNLIDVTTLPSGIYALLATASDFRVCRQVMIFH